MCVCGKEHNDNDNDNDTTTHPRTANEMCDVIVMGEKGVTTKKRFLKTVFEVTLGGAGNTTGEL